MGTSVPKHPRRTIHFAQAGQRRGVSKLAMNPGPFQSSPWPMKSLSMAVPVNMLKNRQPSGRAPEAELAEEPQVPSGQATQHPATSS